MNKTVDGEIDQPLCGLCAEFPVWLRPENILLKQQLEEFFNMKQRQIDMPIILDSQAPSQILNSDSNGQYNFFGELSSVFRAATGTEGHLAAQNGQKF